MKKRLNDDIFIPNLLTLFKKLKISYIFEIKLTISLIGSQFELTAEVSSQ